MTNPENKIHVLSVFWEKLFTVTQLTFIAQSQGNSGWNGRGKGKVSILQESQNTLIFNEQGSWSGEQGRPIDFKNTFRWTLESDQKIISLEHLRLGRDHPVFLFHLALSSSHSLSSIDPHLCGEDTYSGQIDFDHCHFRFNWRVLGPKKNEEINYHYF